MRTILAVAFWCVVGSLVVLGIVEAVRCVKESMKGSD